MNTATNDFSKAPTADERARAVAHLGESETRRNDNESTFLTESASKYYDEARRRHDTNASYSSSAEFTMGPSHRPSMADDGGMHQPERRSHTAHGKSTTSTKQKKKAHHEESATREKKHHRSHHEKRKHHHRHHHKKHADVDESVARRSNASGSGHQRDTPVTRNETSGGSIIADDNAFVAPSSTPRRDEMRPKFDVSKDASGTKHTLAVAAAKDTNGTPPGWATRSKEEHFDLYENIVHGSNSWNSSEKPVAHSGKRTLKIPYYQSDSDSIGHPSSHSSTPEKKRPALNPSTMKQKQHTSFAISTTKPSHEKYPVLGTKGAAVSSGEKRAACTAPLQPEDLEVASPARASGFMDLEAGGGGKETRPGAISVQGPGFDTPPSPESPTNPASPESPTDPPESPMETVSAELVDKEKEDRQYQEDVKNEARRMIEDDAVVAEVVTNNHGKCSRTRLLRWGIPITMLGAIIIGVATWRAASSESPPAVPSACSYNDDLVSLLSTDGSETLLTASTPQNDALCWLSNDTNTNTNLSLSSYSDNRKIQRYVLATLYYSTNGEEWKDSTGWLKNPDECEWYNAVVEESRCDDDGSIEGLDLRENNLVGAIPNDLALLADSINELSLGGNSLKGTIPTAFGELTQLTHLSLFTNILSGTVPTELEKLTQLNWLSLEENRLSSGSIPSFLGNMTQLVGLGLGGNQWTGTIPTFIGDLTELKALSLSKNLKGTIPSIFGELTLLSQLSLEKNHLKGHIPTVIGKLTQLSSLRLNGNHLTGTIPTVTGQLSLLKELGVNDNNLTSTIPNVFGNLTQLERLYLYNNTLTGVIPTSMWELPHLRVLALHLNRLTGTIPTAVSQLTQLSVLALDGNRLTGTIPSAIEQLTQLYLLHLYNNSLTGNFTCPKFIVDCLISCDDGSNDDCRSL